MKDKSIAELVGIIMAPIVVSMIGLMFLIGMLGFLIRLWRWAL